MNPQDPCARMKELTLGIEGACRRLAAKRCSVTEAAGMIETMVHNVEICVQQVDLKTKRLQMSLQKTTKIKNQLYEEVQELRRSNSLCTACSSSLEESFSDETDSSASSQTFQIPSSASPVESQAPRSIPEENVTESQELCLAFLIIAIVSMVIVNSTLMLISGAVIQLPDIIGDHLHYVRNHQRVGQRKGISLVFKVPVNLSIYRYLMM